MRFEATAETTGSRMVPQGEGAGPSPGSGSPSVDRPLPKLNGENSRGAISMDISDFLARVVVTATDARALPTDISDFLRELSSRRPTPRIVPEEVERRERTADDHSHEDHVSPAATL